MKSTCHYQILPLLAALVFPALLSSSLQGQTMVGINRVYCPPETDTVVSVPFMRYPVAANLTLSSSAASANPGEAVLRPAQSPGWVVDSLADQFYVRFLSGALVGHWFDVIANDANSLTVDLNGLSPGLVSPGDRLALVQYWTLDGLFPPTEQSTVHVSSGRFGFQQKTKVLLANNLDDGINLPASEVFFLTSSGWLESKPGFPPAGDRPLPPGLPLIIRHPGGVEGTFFDAQGQVLTSPNAIVLAESAEAEQDNPVSHFRPIPIRLMDAGLTAAVFKPRSSHANAESGDLLFLYSGISGVFNPSPSAIYYRFGDLWFRDAGLGANNPAADADVLAPSTGFLIRKTPGENRSLIWLNMPGY
jgi:uncharacterized protein (TIGR02597 family)